LERPRSDIGLPQGPPVAASMQTTSGAFFGQAEDHEAAFHPDVLARLGMRLGAESSCGAPKIQKW
jgi:hypothetical protein